MAPPPDPSCDGGVPPPDESLEAQPCDTSGQEVSVKLGVDGLWTNLNPVDGKVPPGGLRRADDVDIDQPGKAQPRRNTDAVTASAPLSSFVKSALTYSGQMFAWDSTNFYLGTINPGTMVVSYAARGALAWTGSALRYAAGGGDLYVASNSGPLILDGTSGTLTIPGVVRADDMDAPTINANPAGWLANGGGVAYRVVWGRNDAEGRPVLGEPSGRRVVYAPSAGGPFVPHVVVEIPVGVTTTSGHFVQVYRTAAAAGGVDPGDSFFLVWEQAFTAGVLVEFDDVDPFGHVPLYTNPDRGGQASANVRPPLAQDMVSFRDRVWLSNITAPHYLRLRMIAPPDIMAGYKLLLNTRLYALNVAAGTTVSEKIESAARTLVANINANDPDIVATYASGLYDPPGIIDIRRRVPGTSGFQAQIFGGSSVAGAYFVPNLTTAVSSRADVYPNRLHYSRQGLHYAYPLSNTINLGAEEHAIVRVAALRDTLFAFKGKGGDGLWKVTGQGPFYWEQLNATLELASPDGVAVINNTIIAATTQGIVAVTEQGVENISVPVDDVMRQAIIDGRMALAKLVVKSSATEAKVYVGLPSVGGLTPVESYVYNLNTQTWARDTRSWRTMLSNPDGRLVLFEPASTGSLRLERNTGNRATDSAGVAWRMQWNTETAGIPGDMKQFFVASVIFEEAQPWTVDAEMWFTADDDTEGPAVQTGGEGGPYIRAEPPYDQQVTSQLKVEIRNTATQGHTILGMEARHKPVSGYGGLGAR